MRQRNSNARQKERAITIVALKMALRRVNKIPEEEEKRAPLIKKINDQLESFRENPRLTRILLSDYFDILSVSAFARGGVFTVAHLACSDIREVRRLLNGRGTDTTRLIIRYLHPEK